MEKSKLIIIVFFLFCFCNFISADYETLPKLGTFEKNKPIDLLQICVNCDSCNITSVKYPNSSILISGIQMEKKGSEFNYTLNSSYTKILGIYNVNGICSDIDDLSGFHYTYEITPNGEPISTGKSIFYSIIFVVVVVFLIISIFSIGKFEDYSYKMGCCAIAYILLVVTFFLSWQISDNFLTSIPFLPNFLYFLWIVSMVCMFPAFIILVLYLLKNALGSKEIKDLISMGYSESEAINLSRRKK